MLTEEQKQKIEEEEALRSEIRSKLEKKKKGKGCFIQLLIAIVILIIIGIGASSNSLPPTPHSNCTNLPNIDVAKDFSIVKEDKFLGKYAYTLSRSGKSEPIVYAIIFNTNIPTNLSTVALVESINFIFGAHTVEGEIKNVNNKILAIKIENGGYYCAWPVFEDPQKVLSITFWKED